MIQIRLQKSPLKSIKLLLLSGVFVGVSIWMLINNSNSILFWCTLIFFGIGFSVGLFNFLDRRTQIVINKNGIWDRTTNQDVIPWDDVKEAYEFNVGSQIFVALVVSEKFTPKKKLYGWAKNLNKYMGAGDINLSISQITVNTDKLVTLINMLKTEPLESRELLIEKYIDRIK